MEALVEERRAAYVCLGQWLRHFRRHHGVRQAEVAAVLGLGQSNISRLEAGQYALSYADYVRLCAFAEPFVRACDDPACFPPLPLAPVPLGAQRRSGALLDDQVSVPLHQGALAG